MANESSPVAASRFGISVDGVTIASFSELQGITTEVDGPPGRAVARFELEAAEPLPRWAEMWPWIALPGVPIVLFVVHQLLAKRPRTHPPAP